MKKKILSILLVCAMVLQSGAYVLADVSDTEKVQNEWGGGISELDIADGTEVQKENEIFTSERTQMENTSQEQMEEGFTDAPAAEDTEEIFFHEETDSLLKSSSVNAAEIDWNNQEAEYWASIDWATVNWTGVAWEKVKRDKVDWGIIDWSTIEWGVLDMSTFTVVYLDVNRVDWSQVNWSSVDWKNFGNWNSSGKWADENIFWEAVDWSQVNWKSINWNSMDIHKVQLGNNNAGWSQVDWSKVDWDVVNWVKIKALKDASYIDYTIEFPSLNGNTIPTTFGKIYQYNTIPSNKVKITIKKAGVVQCVVPSSAYTVFVDDDKKHLSLVGNWSVTPGTDNACADIFSAADKKIILQESNPALDDASYWDIEVDDSKCNFAVPSEERGPKVTIQSVDGKVKLEEGTDFTVRQEDNNPTICKKYKLRIYAVPTSGKVSGIESSAGYITRTYNMHFVNVADYYNLKGIPETVICMDMLPKLTRTEDDWQSSIHLEEKPEISDKNMGALPTTKMDGKDLYPLWKERDYLTLEYQYDGKNWVSTINWSDWRSNHISDTVNVRASVVEGRAGDPPDYPYYYETTSLTHPRYIKGSIYGSFRVIPYSLAEVNPDKTPATIPLSNGMSYLAVVNPKETLEEQEPTGCIYKDVQDQGIIGNFVYNGKACQQNDLRVKVYSYSLGAYGWCYWNDPAQWTPSYTVEWKNNINAGTASAVISFSGNPGNFNGSITRNFTIEPKEIKDVAVDASDFAYDGNDHLPKLIILDSDTQKVLQEGADKDYTVKVVSGSTKNPGEVVVEITGHGNYKGTTQTAYKIISTSSGSTPAAPTIADASRYEITLGTATYNGKAQLPEIEVTDKTAGRKLTAGKDYSVEPVSGADNTNAGIGKARIKGITVSGSVDRSFIIKAKPLDDTIQTEASDVTYNGKAQLPQVTVTDTVLKTALAQEKDFILYAGAGADNINVGTGTAVIRGIGNYTGTKDVSFKIAEAYTDEDGNTHYADGSVQAPDGSYLKPGKAMISLAKATGNKVSIYLSGEARGARGYDYVIGTSADMLKTKKYYRVNKNGMNIFTNMYYVGKGTYYAACHAWTRDADGKKTFGQWSELKEFNVTAITPEIPRIIDTKVSGSTVTLTYNKCKNAVGYDIILGTAVKKVNGEMRPVNYGTLVEKVADKNTLTVTFKNVKKGVYYAGLHAYSRTGPNKAKVFSPWSDSQKITVK